MGGMSFQFCPEMGLLKQEKKMFSIQIDTFQIHSIWCAMTNHTFESFAPLMPYATILTPHFLAICNATFPIIPHSESPMYQSAIIKIQICPGKCYSTDDTCLG